MSFHSYRFEIKAVSDEGAIEGLASSYNLDQGGDIVVPGAFKDSLSAHSSRGSRVRMLRDHDPHSPIGVWERVAETTKGLEVAGRLTLGVEKARETLALLKAGAMDGLSIGYRTLLAVRDSKTGARLLEKVDLYEISIVTFPMNTDARVIAVKADDIETERDYERFLREAGFSRERARGLAKGYRAAAADPDGDAVADLLRSIRERTASLT